MDVRAAIIIALGLALGGFFAGGIYSVTTGGAASPSGGTVYVVNRFTGSAQLCAGNGCRTLGIAFPDDLVPIPPNH